MEYVGNNVGKTMYLVLADYNYGHISEGFIQQYAAENGIEIVGEEYIPMSVSQFSSTISNIQQLQPDIVYTLLVGSPQLSFFTQWAAAGVDDITIVSNCNVGGMNHEHTTLQAPSMAGAVGVTNFMDELKYSDDKAEEFVSKFNQKYPDEAYVYNECATSYDAIYLYAAAVEKAGSADTDEVIKAF
jgi:branched-chain amino acid transport system substrate-binding protein